MGPRSCGRTRPQRGLKGRRLKGLFYETKVMPIKGGESLRHEGEYRWPSGERGRPEGELLCFVDGTLHKWGKGGRCLDIWEGSYRILRKKKTPFALVSVP